MERPPRPCVALVVSKAAQAIALKNGVRFEELLQPFSVVAGADALVRSVSRTYRLQNFALHWYDVTSLSPPSERDITKALLDAVEAGDPAVDTDPVPPRKGSPLFSPWFDQFRGELNAQMRCQEHEMFEQPVAMIFVAATTDVDPIATFDELASAKRLPRAFAKRHYDGAIPRFHVLLDDVGAGETAPTADAILRRMKSTFLAPNCKLLQINSIGAPTPGAVPAGGADLWGTAEAGAEHLRGAHLSADDLKAIAAFTADLSVKHVLPTMERRMFQLNSEIEKQKKGFKNALKSWWRKPKAEAAGSASGAASIRYPHDSIEARIRLLADYAYMLEDYAMAMQFYRMVDADFKADNARLHRGGVLRMLCKCEIKLNEPSASYVDHAKVAAQLVGRAASHESSAGTSGAMLVLLRAQLLVVDALLAAGGTARTYVRQAADALVAAAEHKPDAFAALLLEQAAAFYARCTPVARSRKHAFHMVRAGHLYRTSEFNRHAARCHNIAATVYSGGGWHRIEDHVNSALWKEAKAFEDDGASTGFLRKLLRDGRRSAERQAAYMADYLATTAAESAAAEAPGASERARFKLDLGLPAFDDASLVVELHDNAFAAELAAELPSASPGVTRLDARSIDPTLNLGRRAATTESWARLREALATELEPSPSEGWAEHATLLPPPPRRKARHGKRGAAPARDHALGERLIVALDVCNPLAIPLELDCISLRAQHGGVAVPAAGDARVEIVASALTLAPMSTATLRLVLVPRALGELQITGLQWRLAGQVWGRKDFDLRGTPLTDSREHRGQGARIADRRLFAHVVAPRPWLGITLDGVPSEMLVGEVCRATVTLTNCSDFASIANLRAICSVPIVAVGSGGATCVDPIGVTGRLLPLHECETIAPGASKTVHVWLRAPALDSPSHVALLFRFNGEGGEGGGGGAPSPHREVQLALALRTRPSLEMTTTVAPSARGDGSMLMHLRVVNRCVSSCVSANVDVAGIVVLSKAWRAASMGAVVRRLQRGEGMGLVARLSAVERNAPREAGAPCVVSALAPLEGECSFIYRYISHESCSQFDSLPLTSLTISPAPCVVSALAPLEGAPPAVAEAIGSESEWALASPIANLVALANAELLVTRERARVYIREMEKAKAAEEGGPSTIQAIRRENQSEGDGGAEGGRREVVAAPLPWSVDALWHGGGAQNASDGENEGALHVAVLWKAFPKGGDAATSKRWGVIPLLRIPTSTVPAAPIAASLGLSAAYESEVVHDFAAASVCAVPLTITLRNTSSSASAPLAFGAEFVAPGEVLARGGAATVAPRPWLRWAGTTRQRIEGLAPGASVELTVNALVSQAGVYDLNRLRLTAEDGEVVLFGDKTLLLSVETPAEL